MIKLQNPVVTIAFFLMSVGGLSACSTIDRMKHAITDDNIINYQNNQAIKLLEVPPDLTKPEFDKSFDIPVNGVNATYRQNSSTNQTRGISRVSRGSSLEKLGSKTYLRINDTYQRSLIRLDDVLLRMGFTLLEKTLSGTKVIAKYNGKDVQIKEGSSFINKMFGTIRVGEEGKKTHINKALLKGEIYVFLVENKAGTPYVSFARKEQKRLPNAAKIKVLQLMNAEFNR